MAQWDDHDAREEIRGRLCVSLKAGLMLSDIGSAGFRVDNFNRDNMDIFENKWDDIKSALLVG